MAVKQATKKLPEKEKMAAQENKIKSRYTPVLVVLLIVAAFFLGSLSTKVSYLEKGSNTAVQPTPTQAQGQAAAPGKKVDVAIGNLPILGNKNAKVTIIEFADYQCPFCSKWFTDVEAKIIKDYVDTGKVKFAYRDYAFLGDESKSSAQATRCANDQGKFWEFHDYLFNHQNGENQGAFSADNLKGFASTLGLSADQFNSCMDSGKYAKAVDDDLAAGQKAGVQGTPTAFVNGQILVGAQPYDAFKKLIDEELKK